MFIQNYDLIRADRSQSGGGVCLYVKNCINYLNRNDLIGENLEAICIEIFKPSSASFIVGTIYRPPSAFVDSFSNIEQLVKLIDDENKEFYLLGDLNANMLDNSNNSTKNLNVIMELFQLTQTISSPTRVTMTSSSLLDVCINPTPEKLVTSRVVPIAISDHYLILTIRKINIHLNQNRNKKIEIRNFKHFCKGYSLPISISQITSEVGFLYAIYLFRFKESATATSIFAGNQNEIANLKIWFVF